MLFSGRFAIIKYAFLRRALKPNGRFFMTWEIYRILIGFIITIIGVGYSTIFVFSIKYTKILLRIADVTYIVDLYIRMHCRYYNENGIMVTHPWSTMKHYLSTAFTIDFITYFPANFFKLYLLLGRRNKIVLKILFRILVKPLIMHRFFSFLTYFQTNITNQQSALIQKIKYTVLVLTIISMSSSLLVTQVCSLTEIKGVSVTIEFHNMIMMNLKIL